MSLSRKTLEHPVLILIVFALLGVVGIFTLSNVAIALMPEVENPSLSINTTYTNAGPESVEKTVTKLIENAVMSVNGLKNITSTSNESNSSVQLEFEYGTDLTEAMYLVKQTFFTLSDIWVSIIEQSCNGFGRESGQNKTEQKKIFFL